MNQISQLPVLILAYNRFDKFYKCINTLREQGIKKIFLSIDGPINKNDIYNQEKIFRFCDENSNDLEIKINFLEHNNGCRLGPLKGISWFFDKNEYGVILEDDVIVSKKCMEVFNILLKEKFNDKNYMSLSSFNEFTNKEIESLYSLPVWRSWGWASWSDRWKFHIEFSKKICNYNLFQIYNLLPNEFKNLETVKLIKCSQLNLLDAWDYEFNFTHIVNKKHSLTIGGINNFVYGFDNMATHTYDIDSIGVDFNLFVEREIKLKEEIPKEKKQIKDTLEKCGFFISENNNSFFLIKNFLNIIFTSFILYLRKTKKLFTRNCKKY